MSPHEKSARGAIVTKLICLPFTKYRRSHKKSPHYMIAPPRKVFPADNLPVKIRPARPGETFLGKGRSYNGTLAYLVNAAGN